MAVTAGRIRHVIVAGVVLALLIVGLPATPAQAADARSVERIQTILENKINNARTARGLRPLKVNRKLEYWATDHARYMAGQGRLVHDTMPRLQKEAPKTALSWGENIARNTATNAARRAHQMFMNSPGHRANVLSPTTTHMGVGVVKRGNYTYLVERFATLP